MYEGIKGKGFKEINVRVAQIPIKIVNKHVHYKKRQHF